MKKKGKISSALCIGGALLVTGVTVLLNSLAFGKYDNILEQYLGKMDDSIQGDLKGADAQYVKSDFSSPKELYEKEEELCAKISEEGITLLENDGLLPLKKNTTLSLFSHSSVDLVSGGSGSGSGSFELTSTLKEGLEASSLKVNEKLWNFYESGNGSSYKRGVGVINYGQALDWKINECPLNVITSEEGLANSYGDSVAMFVLSRTGGEGGDEARDMEAYGGKRGTHYLEPDDTELEIIDYLNKTFEHVIILVNCNNAMELGWSKKYEHIDAIINFPGAGRRGTYGLGRILVGEDENGNKISPSGHLTDTFVYDNFSSPAMQNMGDYHYKDSNYYYVNYSEGIYVGYKYYETRYEDYVLNKKNVGSFKYEDVVNYPFGYGLSYSKFSWSDFKFVEEDEGNFKVQVTVKNSGDRAGKDVVQLYKSSPYTTYDIENGIEKSSVDLLGFAKTSLLEPNEEETVTLTFTKKDLISYDSKNLKSYFLEDGDYYFSVADNAHSAINNILLKKKGNGVNVDETRMSGEGNEAFAAKYHQSELDSSSFTTYSNENGDGKITNLFDDCTLSDAKYLSRNKWDEMDNDGLRYGEASSNNSGAEINGKQWEHVLDDALRKKLDSRDSLNPNEGKESNDVTFDKKNGIDLIDLRGKPYSDQMWEALLDEISLSELNKLIEECGYCSPAMSSINKPKVNDLDGPAGLNKVVGHGSLSIGDGYLAMTWASNYLLASTWNPSLAYEMGKYVGEDGLYGNVCGWYGPAMNIHRTPFAGRNFEYYSEDPYLSGIFGREAVNGASSKGMYGFIKHFALNDQETHRDHLGLITWASEQTIRETYLKPFEMCIKDNFIKVSYNDPIKDANGNITGYTKKEAELPATFGLMTSFNRIGTTWAGGNYNLITGVLRNEWGYNGFVLTDYEVPSYMVTNQALAAGGDAKLKTVDMVNLFNDSYSLKNNKAYQTYARNAAHHILYTVVNSAGMNGYVHGCRFVNGFAYYKFILIGFDAIALISVSLLTIKVIKNIRKAKKED